MRADVLVAIIGAVAVVAGAIVTRSDWLPGPPDSKFPRVKLTSTELQPIYQGSPTKLNYRITNLEGRTVQVSATPGGDTVFRPTLTAEQSVNVCAIDIRVGLASPPGSSSDYAIIEYEQGGILQLDRGEADA